MIQCTVNKKPEREKGPLKSGHKLRLNLSNSLNSPAYAYDAL